jgi:hypothetical protein
MHEFEARSLKGRSSTTEAFDTLQNDINIVYVMALISTVERSRDARCDTNRLKD